MLVVQQQQTSNITSQCDVVTVCTLHKTPKAKNFIAKITAGVITNAKGCVEKSHL